VRAVFTGFFPTIKGLKIKRHIVDGEWCATVFDFDTTFGNIPMIDCFHVVRWADYFHARVLRAASNSRGYKAAGNSSIILNSNLLTSAIVDVNSH
jgi:hypothetical protein